MKMSTVILLLFYLLPFLAGSSSITLKENIVDGKTCAQILEAFWKQNDMNVEGEYQLITTEKLNLKPKALNQILSEKEQLVEYQRESKQSVVIEMYLYRT